MRSIRERAAYITKASAMLAAAFAAVAMSACSSMTNPTAPTALASSAATSDKSGAVTPATITFADRAGDAITSNGSPYAAQLLSGSSLGFACCTGQIVNYNLD